MRNWILGVVTIFGAVSCGGEAQPDTGAPEGAPADVPTEAEVPPPPSGFLRFRQLGAEDGLLETAVTSYRDPGGRTVSLVSALHLADAAHYEYLNGLFETFDAVLYELIAEPDDRPWPGSPPRGTLSGLQRLLAGGFELQFQLEAIDYRPANFVHADLTPREFQRLQEERQESFVQLVMRAMRAQMAAMHQREDPEPGTESFDLVSAFRAGYGRHMLRMTFATQIEDIERLSAGFSGPDGESVLVEGRNARAMEVLDRVLAEGAREVAIYYGGAHMPDFEERLLARGFTKSAESWLVAWDCHKRKDPERPRSK